MRDYPLEVEEVVEILKNHYPLEVEEVVAILEDHDDQVADSWSGRKPEATAAAVEDRSHRA